MTQVKIGIIGVGSMGKSHCKDIIEGRVANAKLTALCDVSSENMKAIDELAGGGLALFSDVDDFFAKADIDAVVIATPHFSHPELAIKGLKHNKHVMIEKPAGVFAKNVAEMNDIALKSDRVFGIMFNQRTNSLYQKAREIVQSGQLGNLKRVNWTITDWYRSQAYYDSATWRATWSGEGGGVLLNQCPHNIDLLQWICGMPKSIEAHCAFGKYHDIPVEDEVTAYFEYENGANGTFITSTAENPGTNRLEIAGDFGKVIVENQVLTFHKTNVSEREFNATNKEPWGHMTVTTEKVELNGKPPQHAGILKNWVATILGTEDLLAPGVEGINSLRMSNAMILSSWTNSKIVMPMDDEKYYQLLQEKIKAEQQVTV